MSVERVGLHEIVKWCRHIELLAAQNDYLTILIKYGIARTNVEETIEQGKELADALHVPWDRI